MPEPGEDMPRVVFKVNGHPDFDYWKSITSQTPVNSIIQVSKQYSILYII